MGQHKLLSPSVPVVRAGGIGSTLLLLLAASSVGRITVVDHDDVEVSNLHQQVIHTEGRRGVSKARYTHDAEGPQPHCIGDGRDIAPYLGQ